MRLMDRHIFREYLIPLTYCVVGFSMVFVIYDLFDHVTYFIKARTTPLLLAKYYVCLLAPSIEYILPASLLLATLYTLWTFVRHNELVAMRACGVSIYRIMMPFLVIGFLASLGVVAIKELVIPPAKQWADHFVNGEYRTAKPKVFYRRGFNNVAAQRIWLFDELDLARPQRIKGVEVRQERPDRTKLQTLKAERAEWLDGHWWFFNATLQKFQENESPDGPPVELGRIVEIPEFDETPDDFLMELRSRESFSAHDVAHYLRQRPQLSRKDVAQWKTDMHGRLAIPWACLVVTLFAIPAGARTGRQSVLVGVLRAVAFFFAFYALTQVGLFMGKTRVIEPWLGAWLSNIVFLLVGTFMLIRIR